MARNNAEVVMATFPIAPSSSPHTSERLAPSICAEVPMAKPFADLLLIPKCFIKFGPIITEIKAEIITKMMVVEANPPRSVAIVKAIGSVTDFGIKEARSCSFKWNKWAIESTEITPNPVPHITPIKIFL